MKNKEIDSRKQLWKLITNQVMLLVAFMLVFLAGKYEPFSKKDYGNFGLFSAPLYVLVILIGIMVLGASIIILMLNNLIKIKEIKENSSLKTIGIMIGLLCIILPLVIVGLVFNFYG